MTRTTVRIQWDDERFIQMYNDGCTLKEIANEFDTIPQRAHAHARRLKLPKRIQGSMHVPGKLAENLYLNGMDLTSVSKVIGAPRSTVRRVLLMRGVALRKRENRLFDDPTTAKAVRLYRTGKYTYQQIADLLGLKHHNRVGHRIRRVYGKLNENTP